MKRLTSIVLACVCGLWITLYAAPGLAQATVEVEVRAQKGATTDGRVILSGGGKTFGCTTRGARCTISSVPGGPYKVVFQPAGGKRGPARSVMIPPSGKVKLKVAAR